MFTRKISNNFSGSKLLEAGTPAKVGFSSKILKGGKDTLVLNQIQALKII